MDINEIEKRSRSKKEKMVKLENDLMYQVETLNKAPITQAAARDAIRAGAAKLEDAFETTEGRGSIFPGKYIVSSL